MPQQPQGPEEHFELAMLLKVDTECEYCKKVMKVQDSAILLIPKVNKGCTFCSVKCIFKYIARMTKRIILDRKLQKENVLTDSLGYSRKWGPMIPKKELKKKIKGR